MTNEDILEVFNDLEVIMPCDVKNPLLGSNGAAYVFGPQKGAKKDDLPVLDENMQ